jgi:hypothetical protein
MTTFFATNSLHARATEIDDLSRALVPIQHHTLIVAYRYSSRDKPVFVAVI